MLKCQEFKSGKRVNEEYFSFIIVAVVRFIGENSQLFISFFPLNPYPFFSSAASLKMVNR